MRPSGAILRQCFPSALVFDLMPDPPRKVSFTVSFLLAGGFLLLQCLGLTTVPTIMVDEPWYADVAHNAATNGTFVNSTIGAGGGDKTFLFTAISSLFYRCLGTSLWTARFVSVLAGLAGLLGFLAILRRLRIGLVPTVLTALCFIFSNVYYVIFRSVRPEGLTSALGIWALFFVLEMVDTDRLRSAFLAGLVSALAFLSHPNGALYFGIFGLTALVLAIRQQRWLVPVCFGLGGLPVALALVLFALWQWEVGPLEFFGSMLYRTSIDSGSAHSDGIWHNVVRFFTRYSVGIKRLPVVLFEFAALFWGVLWGRGRTRLVATCGLSFFLLAILFLNPFATRHFGEVLFFALVVVAMAMGGRPLKAAYWGGRPGLLVVVSLYLLYNVAGDGYLWYRQAGQTAYGDLEAWIDDRVPDDARVLSLYPFYFALADNELYTGYTRFQHFPQYQDLDDLVASGDLDYIVVSDYLAQDAQTTSGRKIPSSGQRRQKRIYDTLHSAARARGTLVDALETVGYGTIEVYRMKRDEEQ